MSVQTNTHQKQHNVSQINTASLYPNLLPLSPLSKRFFFAHVQARFLDPILDPF